MSFSKDIKNEILSKDIEQDCCCLAFLSGLFSSSANIEISNSLSLSLNTDLEKLCEVVDKIVKKLYGKNIAIENQKSYQIKKEDFYKIIFDDSLAYDILIDTGCLYQENGNLIKCMCSIIRENKHLKNKKS